MNSIGDNHNIKYTFMIIPFKFSGLDEEIVTRLDVFKECDHSKIRYDRLYKHISVGLEKENPNRIIYDYWYNREMNNSHLFNTILYFNVKTETGLEYNAAGYLKDVFAYCFNSGIGFLILNFVFDEDIELDTMCEILNKLKKIKRSQANSLFEIIRDKENIDLYDLINSMLAGLGVEYNLFFQHSSEKYVSATMLSSFTFFNQDECAGKVNTENILDQLECLKRAQGKSYGTFEEHKKYIRPFQNMFWGVSTQGIGNINYNDASIGNISFYDKFYKNVKREYLLMTLLVLNQELTLLDYCRDFSTSLDKIASKQEMERLYFFKIKETFTTVSHLEHYRAFYNLFSEELGVQQLLNEVNTKQNDVYQANKNRISEERQKRERSTNKFTKILSVILSIFGISGLINNIANLINRDNAVELTLIVVSCVIVTVIIVMMISKILESIFNKKVQNKQIIAIKSRKK